MANIEELRLALKITIEAEKEGKWDQDVWLNNVYDDDYNICGTIGCFAGNYAAHLGYKPHSYNLKYDNAINEEGNVISIKEFVTEKLDLTEYQADRLFDMNNSLRDLINLVNEIEGGLI